MITVVLGCKHFADYKAARTSSRMIEAERKGETGVRLAGLHARGRDATPRAAHGVVAFPRLFLVNTIAPKTVSKWRTQTKVKRPSTTRDDGYVPGESQRERKAREQREYDERIKAMVDAYHLRGELPNFGSDDEEVLPIKESKRQKETRAMRGIDAPGQGWKPTSREASHPYSAAMKSRTITSGRHQPRRRRSSPVVTLRMTSEQSRLTESVERSHQPLFFSTERLQSPPATL